MVKPSIEPGAELDGFTIGECVHRGGMATLWSVTHPGITVPLLMKIPRVSEGEDPAAIVSFEMEQMIVPRLAGLHVPACFGSGDFERQPYVVIERIPGKTLYHRLGDLPLGYEEARVIGGKIATALADLHRQNVIHHDIKPSSIMFRDSGEAVLIDFGLSHHNQLPDLLQEEFRLPYGTAPYMAPERLLGVRDDPRSDLFSLGVLLYFFTTGVRPFGETETLRGMRRRLWRDPHPPRKLKADYPPWLQEIVLRCLEIEPVWRHPDGVATGVRTGASRSGQAHRAVGAVAARSAVDGVAPPLQPRADQPRPKSDVAAQLASGPIVAVAHRYRGRLGPAQRVPARHRRAVAGDAAVGAARLHQRAEARPHHHRQDARRSRATTSTSTGWSRSGTGPRRLSLDESRLTVHVLEAIDPASAILEFTAVNHVDHIVIGARQNSLARALLGSVSAKVAAEAACTVTVVRPPRSAMANLPRSVLAGSRRP